MLISYYLRLFLFSFQLQRNGEIEFLFKRAVFADSASVSSAVTGIDHDRYFFIFGRGVQKAAVFGRKNQIAESECRCQEQKGTDTKFQKEGKGILK